METLVIEQNAYEVERHKPMPSKKHSRAQHRLSALLFAHYASQYETFPELTLRLPNAFQDYVPDLAIYEAGKLASDTEEVHVTEIPLCVVEIMLPSQTLDEMVAKINQYFALGVQSAWLVLPALQNIYVYTAPQEYEIYRATQTLQDTKLAIVIDLKQVF